MKCYFRKILSCICMTVLLSGTVSAASPDVLWMDGYFAATSYEANFEDGPVLLWREDGPDNFIGNFFESDGTPICDEPFDGALPGFHNGLAVVGWDGKYGYIDITGAQVIPCQYNAADPFTEDGLALVMKGDRFFFIDMAGNEVLDVTHSYQLSGGFHSGRVLVQEPRQGGGYYYGYLDLEGKMAIPFDFWKASEFKDGLAIVGKLVDDKLLYGCIDPEGDWVIPCEYDQIGNRSEGLVGAKKNNEFTFFTEYGMPVFTTSKYTYIGYFHEGLAAMESDDKVGFISNRGEEVISPQFQYASSFNGGLAQVSNQAWQDGYINSAGTLVIPYMEELKGDDFSEGMALVQDKVEGKNRFGFIDNSGQLVIPPIYKTSSSAFKNGAIVVRGDNDITPGIIRNPVDKPSSWANEGVQSAASLGLTTIRTNRCYAFPITRARFAELIVSFAEIIGKNPINVTQFPFADTADPFVRKAAATGLVNGVGDGTKFDPDAQITREQLAAMLCRAIRYVEQETGKTVLPAAGDLSNYADTDQISAWAVEDMALLSAAGILNGTSATTLSPKDTTTVEQAIIMVLRAYQKF